MAKDWESFKDNYIEKSVNTILKWFKEIESKTMSPIESIAWVVINELCTVFYPGELMYYPQYKIGKYIVDFMVECKPRNLKIVIECDGHEFHEKTKQQAIHDKLRDRTLVRKGYTVLRYTGSEIVNKPSTIFTDIYSLVYKDIDINIS